MVNLGFQHRQKQVSLFRSCTLCVQGSAQKQDVAEPPCRPPSLPLVYTAQEKDPRKGSGVFAVGPPVPLTRGLRSSRGRGRFLLPLIPWRRHGSHPGEAPSEEAVCCGWAVTPLGWHPACRAGPRDSVTPLGLAGGGEPWRPGVHRPLARGRGTAVRRRLAGFPCPPPPPYGAAVWLTPCAAPPPLGWGFRFWCQRRPALCRSPAGGGGLGGGRGGLLPCPPALGGEKRKGERRCRSLAPARGARGLVGGGGGSSGCDPPSASLAALWHFCWHWAPSAGPCSDAHFLPLPSPDWLSRS